MRKIIKGVLKAIYKVLSVFNLQFALLVLEVGVVLYFCGVFEGGGIPLLIFCMLFICSILAAVIITIKKLFSIGTDKNKGSTLQILSQSEASQSTQNLQPPQTQQVPQPMVVNTQPQQEYNQTGYVGQTQTSSDTPQERPAIYRVKQNPNYVMAEYSDRYELFLITPQGLKKVRTDLKQRG